MGTRSLTYTYDDENSKIMALYRQYDGYPSGHGMELSEILKDTQHNGMECLSASIVARLKRDKGGIYLYAGSNVNMGQEYEYHVYNDKVHIIKCFPKRKAIFSGDWEQFLNFTHSKEAEAI